MTEITPGQAFRATLHERWTARGRRIDTRPWEALPEIDREDLEAAVQAAIAVAPHAVEASIREMAIEQFGDAIRAGTDRLLAEKLPEIQAAATRHLRGQLAATRGLLEKLASDMEHSARVSSPSKKSEIERGCAEAVRGIAAGIEASQ